MPNGKSRRHITSKGGSGVRMCRLKWGQTAYYRHIFSEGGGEGGNISGRKGNSIENPTVLSRSMRYQITYTTSEGGCGRTRVQSNPKITILYRGTGRSTLIAPDHEGGGRGRQVKKIKERPRNRPKKLIKRRRLCRKPRPRTPRNEKKSNAVVIKNSQSRLTLATSILS